MFQKLFLLSLIVLLVGCSTKNPRRHQNDPHYNQELQDNDDEWGRARRVSSRYEYVTYSKNHKARALINFRTGRIRVETTASHAPKTILLKVIRTTILSIQNPQEIDLFAQRDTVQKGIPFLYGKVLDDEGQPIRWVWRAERYANYLMSRGLRQDTIKTSKGLLTRYWVTFNMKQPKNYHISDVPYMDYVRHSAKRFGINEALILGIIQTESHFNPYAISTIPAYGLMQVVPSSAGADAWNYLYGKKGRPSKNYLFNAKNNIEMGTAYMRILFREYLVGIKDLKSREYCAIAAYNTGAGNVLRSFSKNKDKAFGMINRMSPKKVYAYLKRHLPHKETRRYLVKVVKAKNAFY